VPEPEPAASIVSGVCCRNARIAAAFADSGVFSGSAFAIEAGLLDGARKHIPDLDVSTKSSDRPVSYRPIAVLITALFVRIAIRSALWGEVDWSVAWIARRLAFTARRID
jgi:hypothetical protein